MKFKSVSNEYRVQIVEPDVSFDECQRILSEIHDIALEIALGSEKDGLCEVRVG